MESNGAEAFPRASGDRMTDNRGLRATDEIRLAVSGMDRPGNGPSREWTVSGMDRRTKLSFDAAFVGHRDGSMLAFIGPCLVNFATFASPRRF